MPVAQLSIQQPNAVFLTKTICLGPRKANAVSRRAGLVGSKGVHFVRQPAAHIRVLGSLVSSQNTSRFLFPTNLHLTDQLLLLSLSLPRDPPVSSTF